MKENFIHANGNVYITNSMDVLIDHIKETMSDEDRVDLFNKLSESEVGIIMVQKIENDLLFIARVDRKYIRDDNHISAILITDFLKNIVSFIIYIETLKESDTGNVDMFDKINKLFIGALQREGLSNQDIVKMVFQSLMTDMTGV